MPIANILDAPRNLPIQNGNAGAVPNGGRDPAAENHIGPAIEVIGEIGECVYQWRLGELQKNGNIIHHAKQILLYKNEDELLGQSIDEHTNQITEFQILFEGAIEEEIERLSDYAIVDFVDNAPRFDAPDYLKWVWEEELEISLFPFKQDLIWQVTNFNSGISSRSSLAEGAKLNSEKCHKFTKDFFQKFTQNNGNITNAERIEFFKNFTVAKIERKGTWNEEYQLYMVPLSQKSRIDPRVEVSSFTWGVTLVADGTGISKNHAVIVFEGIDEEGNYFLITAEFDGSRIIVDTPEQFRYDERTKIHMVPKEQVEVVLEVIREQQREYIGFSQYGSLSIFSGKKHNCCTWAMDILAIMGIKFKIPFGFIATATKTFTHGEKYFKKQKIKQAL